MDERTLKVLEYNKIIERLADFAYRIPQEMALRLKPVSDRNQIEQWQEETSEAESILAAREAGFWLLSRCQAPGQEGGDWIDFDPQELLQIAQVLALISSVKSRMNEYKDKAEPIDSVLIESMKTTRFAGQDTRVHRD